MNRTLPLFIMVDACGWEIVKNDPFLQTLAPHRQKLRSIFGYSSTCVPSILSGRTPVQHRNWCYFIHSPQTSPFKPLRWLQWLPKALTSRRIVRRLLTKLVKKHLGFEGYFDLYNIPFQHIASYDFTEKKSPLKPGGMNRGGNIFDDLEKAGTRYFVSDPDKSEEQNRDELIAHIEARDIDFAFIYWAGLDGLLHRVGNDSPLIGEKLREYEQWIATVQAAAARNYDEVPLHVFSDHGMANCDIHLDLMSKLEALPLRFGKDYSAVYDSTMARFWFHTPGAREQIETALKATPEGRIMPDSELAELDTLFEDRAFGELIYLVPEGTLIVPSHMGERPIRAMHGYHPDEPHSYATLFTSEATLPAEVRAINDIYKLMHHYADSAHNLPLSASSTDNQLPIAA